MKMMRVVCAGYCKVGGEVVRCGRLIGEIKSRDGGVSHGMCGACFKAFKKEILADRKRGRNAS